MTTRVLDAVLRQHPGGVPQRPVHRLRNPACPPVGRWPASSAPGRTGRSRQSRRGQEGPASHGPAAAAALIFGVGLAARRAGHSSVGVDPGHHAASESTADEPASNRRQRQRRYATVARERPRERTRRLRAISPMLPYSSKTFSALVTLIFVTIFNFFLFRVMPGDPAKTFAPRGATTTRRAERDARGLGEGQAAGTCSSGHYINSLFHGNLGVLVLAAGDGRRSDLAPDLADRAAVRHRAAPVRGDRHVARHAQRLASWHPVRPDRSEQRRGHLVLGTRVVDRADTDHRVRVKERAGPVPDRAACSDPRSSLPQWWTSPTTWCCR